MTPIDILAHSLRTSQKLVHRYCEDLKPQEYLHRPCAQANCAAWLLGHLILSDRGVLMRLGVSSLPALPDGFDQRFARDAEAPRSDQYGDVTMLLPMFMQWRSLLIESLPDLGIQALSKPLEKPHPMFSTAGEMVGFMAHHATMHAGQITIIRRSLGRPPLV